MVNGIRPHKGESPAPHAQGGPLVVPKGPGPHGLMPRTSLQAQTESHASPKDQRAPDNTDHASMFWAVKDF